MRILIFSKVVFLAIVAFLIQITVGCTSAQNEPSASVTPVVFVTVTSTPSPVDTPTVTVLSPTTTATSTLVTPSAIVEPTFTTASQQLISPTVAAATSLATVTILPPTTTVTSTLVTPVAIPEPTLTTALQQLISPTVTITISLESESVQTAVITPITSTASAVVVTPSIVQSPTVTTPFTMVVEPAAGISPEVQVSFIENLGKLATEVVNNFGVVGAAVITAIAGIIVAALNLIPQLRRSKEVTSSGTPIITWLSLGILLIIVLFPIFLILSNSNEAAVNPIPVSVSTPSEIQQTSADLSPSISDTFQEPSTAMPTSDFISSDTSSAQLDSQVASIATSLEQLNSHVQELENKSQTLSKSLLQYFLPAFLIYPLVIFAIVYLFGWLRKRYRAKSSNATGPRQNREGRGEENGQNWEIIQAQKEEAILQNYLTRMTNLFLSSPNITRTNPNDPRLIQARLETLTTLRALDDIRKGNVIQFLHQITLHQPGLFELVIPAGSNLTKINLNGATLVGAKLQWVSLYKANLQNSNLRMAELLEANLFEANLRFADLRRAVLRRSNLKFTNLEGADLREANLKGADLREANLKGASLKGAIYDYETRWPSSNFKPESLGLVHKY